MPMTGCGAHGWRPRHDQTGCSARNAGIAITWVASGVLPMLSVNCTVIAKDGGRVLEVAAH
ncbi:hypothetical protein, partial [Xanthomonas hortorum]|uniref:hypothetical protein n=1 Tax=Xanthomonas hortorum TaxID=56454 RepID=UPI0019D3B0B6